MVPINDSPLRTAPAAPYPVAGRLVRLVLVLALAASCGDRREPAGGPPPESAWRRIDDGWARAVALDPPIELGRAQPGDALEAVVLPAGPGQLVVESGGPPERIDVEGESRVVVPLRAGGPVTVGFDGEGALLHAPRIVPAGATTAAAPVPRRILLVVVDTLRADAVTPELMPELCAAFADGTRFSHAYSAATWTLPSMASMVTGKPPSELALPDGTLVALAAGEATIAGDLAARGFHTVGISANYTVNHENGFSSGFELFLVPTVLGHGDWPDAGWVLERARRVLEWFPDRDLFLYLHLVDPHDPYRNHETGETLAAPTTGTTVAAAEVERMRVAYASEARRVSALLGEFLRDQGPFERVVVTADHGEEFLEHGGFRHGPTVYPEVSRVPLLVRGAGVPAQTVSTPVSLVGLRRVLGGDDVETLARGGEVEVVSFVHAPPRFAWVDDAGQALLFAHDLAGAAASASRVVGAASAGRAEDGREAAPAADPIGEWLRARLPAIEFVDPEGAARTPTEGEPWGVALRLARRFRGLAPGRWVLVPAGAGRVRLAVAGGADGGWWWGVATRVERTLAVPEPAARRAATATLLEIEGADPYVLAFLPSMAGGSPPVLRALEGDLTETDGPPSTPPSGRVETWVDPGRPAAALEGVEETMRRLRTQGYL